jgi:putative tryptophan/tyrosine transport system substrate-binding protein
VRLREAAQHSKTGRPWSEFIGQRGVVIVAPNAVTILHRDLIIALAAQHRLPAIYPYRLFANSGGFISYGVDLPERYRQAASYVSRILKGEKPGDLPVQLASKFELVINLKTARTLGLTISEPFLRRRGDRVVPVSPDAVCCICSGPVMARSVSVALSR